MTKYIILYFGGKRPASPQEFANILEAWRNWTTQHGRAVIDSGNPLSQAAMVTTQGVEVDANGELPSGYTIIEADSMEQAVKIVRSTPVVAQGGKAVVYESFKVI